MTCSCNKRNKVWLLAGILAGLIVLCVVISLLTAQLMMPDKAWSQHDSNYGHQWLHNELNLTEGEAAAIDAFEPEYREHRTALEIEFQEKIEELRVILITSDRFSPEVEDAIHELHQVHGQLQGLSIRHYFQMMRVLPPDKQARLKELAGQALSIPQ